MGKKNSFKWHLRLKRYWGTFMWRANNPTNVCGSREGGGHEDDGFLIACISSAILGKPVGWNLRTIFFCFITIFQRQLTGGKYL